MDRLRALEVFIEVADAGSLAGAARKLGLSSPSVTRILGEFEQQLSTLLFHRTTRALTLTTPGQAFLVDARRIVSSYSNATDALRGAHREPAGLLRITAPVLFGQYYILPLLTDFMALYPKVKVEAIFLDRTVNIVEEGFDLAVRIGELPDSSMIATKVGTVRKVVCATSNYLKSTGTPQTLQDLSQHKLIGISPLSPTAKWHFKDKQSIQINASIHLSSIAAAIDMVKADWGLAQVLSYQICPHLARDNLQLVLTDHEPPAIPIHLLHAEGRSASAKVSAFVDMAKQTLRIEPLLSATAGNP